MVWMHWGKLGGACVAPRLKYGWNGRLESYTVKNPKLCAKKFRWCSPATGGYRNFLNRFSHAISQARSLITPICSLC